MRTIKTMLAAALAAIVLLAATAAQAQIGSPQTLYVAKVNAGTVSNLNWVVDCTKGKELFLQASWGCSNLISAGKSNLTFMIQYSADPYATTPHWTGTAGAGAAGGAVPDYLTAWTVEANVALGTNHVSVTNLTINAVPYVRVAWVTNGADAYMIATNLYLKAWVK